MHDASSTHCHGLSFMAVLALFACAFQAHGTDTYGPAANELQIPSLRIGNASYSNVEVAVGGVITPPGGTTPDGDPGHLQSHQ